MKVALLNTYSTGGAAHACFRLFQGLTSAAIDASMLVRGSTNHPPGTVSAGSNRDGFIRALVEGLPLHRYPKRQLHNFSPAWMPSRGVNQAARMHPDIIHLHWIPQGFVSINSLQNIACPIVWTLHDSWPFTGGCHLPYDCERYKDSCGSCPALGSTSEQDISRWVFKRKKQAWKSLDITLVSPSFWLARCAQESSLFGGRRIEVIPNGLDLSTFQVMDKQSARSFFSLSGKTKVILFCAVNGLQDHNKGFHFLRSALADLAKSGHGANLELAIAGSIIQDDLPDLGVKTTQFGYIRDDYILNRLYSAADVVIIPSYQEAFGQTATESMACGTPVIAFAATGLLDIVDHQVNGYLARPFDTLDLAEGIHWVLELADYSTLSKNARKKVENYFDSNIVTAKYINLYEQILRKNLYHHDH